VDGPPQPFDTVANRRGIPFLGAPDRTRRSRIGRDKALILNFGFLFTALAEIAKQLFLEWRNLKM